ncbi:MAG TPA: Ig-like domain-containing protein [Anaerolineae bacterium]|nr:Ig-like domain-containing protein [Anaerolineae bacterium]
MSPNNVTMTGSTKPAYPQIHAAHTLLITIIMLTGFLFFNMNKSVFSYSDPQQLNNDITYVMYDSNDPNGPVYNWDDISTTGTLVAFNGYPGPNPQLETVPIGFEFSFFGQAYTELYPHENGFVSFGQPYPNVVPNGTFPNPDEPNNAIALFGGNMLLHNYGADSAVYYQLLDNPTRFVLQYHNLYPFFVTNAPHNLQLVLYPNGDIVTQYLSLATTNTSYVGIENETGTVGNLYDASLADGLAIGYYQADAVYLSPTAQTQLGDVGTTLFYTVTINNQTGYTTSFTLNTEPGSLWPTTLPLTQTAPLPDGAQTDVHLSVDIPPTAAPNDMSFATLNVTSLISPTEFTATTLITATALGTENAYIGLDSNKIAVMDIATQYIRDIIDLAPTSCDYIRNISIPPDGQTIWISCNQSSNLVVIDRYAYTVLATIPTMLSPLDMTFTADGAYVILGYYGQYQIDIFDTSTYNLVTTIPLDYPAQNIVTHPYWPRAYATTNSGVHVLDTTTFTITNFMPTSRSPHYLAISQDGLRLYGSTSFYTGQATIGSIATFDLLQETEIAFMNNMFASAGGPPSDLAVSADGDQVFVAGANWNRVSSYDTNTFLHSTDIPMQRPEIVEMDCAGDKLVATQSTYNQNYPGVYIVDTELMTVTATANLDIDNDGSDEQLNDGLAICPQHVTTNTIVLEALNQPAIGTSANHITHELVLINAMGTNDTFNLTIGNHLWSTTLGQITAPNMAHGDLITLTAIVTIPVDAQWYLTDTAIITATSTTNPAITAQTIIETKNFAYPNLNFTPESYTYSQTTNISSNHVLTITNGHGITTTPQIEVLGENGLLLPATNDHPIPGQPYKPFTVWRDIVNNGRYWHDGGNDALDGFGFPYIRVGETSQNLLMSPESLNVLTYTINNYTVIVTNTFVGDNIYKMTVDSAAGQLPRSDIDLGMGGNVGSDNNTIAYEDSFWIADNEIRYLLSNDGGGIKSGDPQIMLLLLPSHQDDLTAVTYQQSADNLNFSANDIQLPATFYIILSYYDVDNLIQWLTNDIHLTNDGWLTATPITPTLPSNTTQTIDFTFSSVGVQPGTHQANIVLKNQNPHLPAPAIPVTMTVIPTADMGWLSGIVTDEGTNLPIPATLSLNDTNSVTANPLTGEYEYWLPAGPQTIEISAPGYLPQTQSVNITAGTGTEQNFTLTKIATCWATSDNGNTIYSGLSVQAVQHAIEAAPPEATIKIAGDCKGVYTVNNLNQTLFINKDLTIQGGYTHTNWLAQPDPTTFPTILNAQEDGRVVYITGTTHVTLAHLSLINGATTYQSANGAGIFHVGLELNLLDVLVAHNTSYGYAGGIYNSGIMTITDTILQNNRANGSQGGGIFNDGSTTLINTTLQENGSNTNYPYFQGAGLYNNNASVAQLINSFVLSNTNTAVHSYYGTLIIDNTLVNGNTGTGVYNGNGSLELRNSTISHNEGDYGGGVFTSYGTLYIDNTNINNNYGNRGGGIFNANSTSTIQNSTISHNAASPDYYGVGGGIYLTNVTLTASNNIISHNTSRNGGGIYIDNGTAQVDITNSAIFDNNAITDGGGLFTHTPITITNSTVSHNQAGSGGAFALFSHSNSLSYLTIVSNTAVNNGDSFYFVDGSVSLANTIVAYHPTANCQSSGNITSNGYNLSSDNSCDFAQTGDLNNIDPQLLPLTNDSNSWLHPLPPTSPAVNQIPLTVNGCGTTITNDQRNAPRPSMNSCDIGAYEIAPFATAPTAAHDTYTVAEDNDLIITAPGLLANDYDLDGDTFTLIGTTDPAHGTVTALADGSFTYEPAANFYGTDSFSYEISDGQFSDTAIVTITVTAVNDTPLATPDTYNTTQNESISISAPGVLANDTDVDGDSLTAILVQPPSSGTLNLMSDGSFTYTPSPDFVGTVTFTYYADDRTDSSNTTTVTINVQQTDFNLYLPIIISP